jgi:hypothetical protein
VIAQCGIVSTRYSIFGIGSGDRSASDCGVDVHLIDEYYSVCNDVWNQAWIGRYRSPIGDGQLCIGCLEARLGRTLASDDFIAVPINDTAVPMSDRLRDRLALSAVGHHPARQRLHDRR